MEQKVLKYIELICNSYGQSASVPLELHARAIHLNSIIVLILGFIALGLFLISCKVFAKAWKDLNECVIHGSAIVALVSLICASIVLFNSWNWVGAIDPQCAAAHEILMEAKK